MNYLLVGAAIVLLVIGLYFWSRGRSSSGGGGEEIAVGNRHKSSSSAGGGTSTTPQRSAGDASSGSGDGNSSAGEPKSPGGGRRELIPYLDSLARSRKKLENKVTKLKEAAGYLAENQAYGDIHHKAKIAGLDLGDRREKAEEAGQILQTKTVNLAADVESKLETFENLNYQSSLGEILGVETTVKGLWTTVPPKLQEMRGSFNQISRFDSESKRIFKSNGVVLGLQYPMVSFANLEEGLDTYTEATEQVSDALQELLVDARALNEAALVPA